MTWIVKATATVVMVFAFAGIAAAQQVVYLDFTSRTGAGDHTYTTTERNGIRTRMIADYAAFDFQFTLTQPTSGDYTTLFFNDGDPLGEAEIIDFRNLDRSDTATIQVSQSGASTSTQYIILTANVASHELGHLQGLRHADSFGPIGSGRDPNSADASSYAPNYLGPATATATRNHLMESDSLSIEYTTDQYFGPREAVKLTFNEHGTVVAETAAPNSSIAAAQAVNLYNMAIPRTQPGGTPGEIAFYVDSVVVTGARSTASDDDYFSFQGFAGDLFNFEVISDAIEHRVTEFDTAIYVYGPNNALVNYFGTTAYNDDETEGFDSIILDLTLPTDGIYKVRVGATGANQLGQYELFMYRLSEAPPEPVLAGDFNDDGIVDAADYTIWRDTVGASGTGLAADQTGSVAGTPDGVVNSLDFAYWRDNFGSVAATVAPGIVPEPATWLLTSCAVGLAIAMHRRTAR